MCYKSSIHFIFLLVLCTLVSCTSSTEKNTEKTLTPTASNIDSLLNIYPDSINLLVFRGNLAFDDYRFYDALADGAKAFRLDSTDFEARLLYANALNNKENRTVEEVQAAQQHFLYLLKQQAQDPKLLVSIASTYRFLQDVDNAFKYVNQALKVDKHTREAYALKGSMYMDLENYKLAKSSYQTAIQQDPDFYEAYFHLAVLYHREKDPICLEYYRTAYELKPDNDELLYSYSFALAFFQDFEKATNLYRKLAQSEEKYYKARGYFHLGHIKQRVDYQLDSAIFFYSKAIDNQKDYVEAYHNRGMCYEAQGNIQSAKMEYMQALKYDKDFTLSNEAYHRLKNQ